MASLVFSTPDEVIKNLFHAQSGDFEVRVVVVGAPAKDTQGYIVAVFFIVSLLLCTWTLGLPIPSGLLVPSLMIGLCEGCGRSPCTGAAGGRFFGIVINSIVSGSPAWADVCI